MDVHTCSEPEFEKSRLGQNTATFHSPLNSHLFTIRALTESQFQQAPISLKMSGNSCAGFVQFRAGPAIIDRVAEVNTDIMTEDISFISEYDGFVMKQDAPRYFQIQYISD